MHRLPSGEWIGTQTKPKAATIYIYISLNCLTLFTPFKNSTFLPTNMNAEATTRLAKSNAAQLDEEEKRRLRCLAQVFHREKRRENKTLLVATTKETWSSVTSWQSRSHIHIEDQLHQENNTPLPLMAWSAGPLPSTIITSQESRRRDALLTNPKHAKQNLANSGHNIPLDFQAYTIGNETKNVKSWPTRSTPKLQLRSSSWKRHIRLLSMKLPTRSRFNGTQASEFQIWRSRFVISRRNCKKLSRKSEGKVKARRRV